jgi:hypothetical protein
MTMTRETKVGVVVCLSFLCLVGVVLGCKLRGDATEEEEQVVLDGSIPDPTPVDSASSRTVRIPTQAPPGGPPVIPASAVQNSSPLPPPPQAKSSEQFNTIGETNQNHGLPLPPPPVEVQPSVVSTGQVILEQETEEADNTKSPGLGLLSVFWSAQEGLNLVGSMRSKPAAEKVDSVVEVAPMPGDVPPPVAASPSASAPGPASVLPLPPPSPLAKPEVRGANPEEMVKAPLTNSGDQTAGGTTSKPEEIKLSTPAPPSATPAPPNVDLLQPALARQGKAGETTPGTGSSQSIVPVSASDNPRPIGAMPTATTPPIAVPTPGGGLSARSSAPAAPQVESYDEEVYRTRAGDTFAKISQSHFNTDKYDKALERFNVEHPQASDALRQDPSRLEANQLIFIPPAYILEKRYGASLIPGYKPQAESSASVAPRTANAAPRTDGNWNTAQGFKLYQVKPDGESMWDIARSTLNNPSRWNEIAKLNPSLRPEYRIPGKTQIKLPADARVETASAPQQTSR